MTDESLRRSQRDRDLDPAEEVRWLSEQLRSGAIDRERLELAAYLGHAGAQELTAPDGLGEEWSNEEFTDWVVGLARWGPECAVRAGLSLLGLIPLGGYGANRFDGPDDHVLAAHETLAAWVRGETTPEQLQAAQEGLQGGGYGYGLAAALNCAFPLLRIPLEKELSASLLREACENAQRRVAAWKLLRELRDQLCPWALGERDPLQRVLADRGARWVRLDGLTRGLVWERERVWCASSAGTLTALTLDGEPQLELSQRERDVYAFAGGPRGQLAVGEDSGACEVWLDPTQPGHAFHLGDAARSMAFSPDGLQLWVGRSDGKLDVLELGSGFPRRLIDVDTRAVNAVCFAGDEVWVAARDAGLTVFTREGSRVRRVALEASADSLTALPDGRVVAGCEKSLLVFDPRGGEPTRLTVHDGSIYSVVAVPGSTAQVVTASGDGTLRWLDLDAQRVLRAWQTPSTLLTCAVSPDGSEALSGARTGLLRRHPLVE